MASLTGFRCSRAIGVKFGVFVGVAFLWVIYVSILNKSDIRSKVWIGVGGKYGKDCASCGVPSFSPKILKNGSHFISYPLEGRVFTIPVKTIKHNITTCVLHSFTEEVIEENRNMFTFAKKDNKEIFTTSVAVVWHEGRLHAVTRLWLYQASKRKEKNKFLFHDSFLYFGTYNEFLQPTASGRFLDIPSPIINKERASGPEDPRAVTIGGRFLIFYSMVMQLVVKSRHTAFFIYDVGEYNRRILKPEVENYKVREKEKNWCPIVLDGVLHFVYSFDPLQVMQCDNEAKCKFIHKDKKAFDPEQSYLRGGSPFEQYRGVYYLSAAHSKWQVKDKKMFELNAHFVLIRTDQWRIVYVSDVIRIDFGILKSTWHLDWISAAFVYPTGILIESEDVVSIAANIGDSKSLLFRVKGLKSILDEAIALDQVKNYAPPEVGSVQSYVGDQSKREYEKRIEIYSKPDSTV